MKRRGLVWIARVLLSATAAMALMVNAMVVPAARAEQMEPSDPTPLAARLGGTLQSFTALYGPPIATNVAIGAVFDVAGYGLVAVQFDLRSDAYEGDDPALLITLRAPRPAGAAATAPHPADWSQDDARRQAHRFLPADVILGEPSEAGEQTIALSCGSAALTLAFGAATEDSCRVSLITPTPKSVSFITLTVITGPVDTAPSSRRETCDGMTSWAKTAADRMTTARSLLADIQALNSDDPQALDELVRIEAAFARLAADQRESAFPSSATKANYFLIGAFTDFALAAKNAHDGLASGEDDKIDQAVASIEAANHGIQRATDAITAAVADCGLVPGTPAPAQL